MSEKKRKRRLIFSILLISLTVLLFFSLFLGYKNLKAKIISILSNPIDLGLVLIVPQNFEAEFPIKFKWSSIKISLDGTDLFLKNPVISIDPALNFRRELLNVSIDSVYAKIISPTDSLDSAKNKEYTEHISHPDLWLPFRVSVNVNKAAVDVENIGAWKLDSLSAIKSGRQKRFNIRAVNISGSHLVKNLFLNAEYMWNELFSDASISVSDKKNDSLLLILNAPIRHLEDLSAEINLNVADLPLWLKDKWPNDAPRIGTINLTSNVSLNLLTGKSDFNLALKTKMDELWQLPVFDVSINAFGSDLNISHSEIILTGSNGERIKFNGGIDKNLDGSGELEVEGIDITLGPETLPADVKIHKITKKGNSVSANFTTGAGSHFSAKIADINNPVITFTADVASKEPWAVQWTGDMVKLAKPTILTGSFSFKDVMLKAHLKTGIPFAYYAAADELDVSLWLNSEGIHFPNGTIKRNGYESDFTGQVMWNEEHFTFKVNQQSGGDAEVYGTFNPRIELALNNLNTLELPFADTTMLKGYNGIVSGTWNHDFENKNGQASVSVSTVIQNYAANLKSDLEIDGNFLTVNSFELEQNEKKVSGSLSALLPSETEKNFEIQQAKINIPNMDLVSLLAIFKDSTLSNGNVNGGLEYSKGAGLTGGLVFSKVAIKSSDSGSITFPNITLNASGRSAKISAPLFWNEGLWNGRLETGVDSIGKQKELPVFIFYTASNIDNKGSVRFDGFLNKDTQKIYGDAKIKGDWFLPNGIGEIKNADISISAKTELGKSALDSLNANFNTKHNIFEKGILKIPFSFSGRVNKGMLFADSIFVYGQNDEKVTAKLQFDLRDATLKDISFNTQMFTLVLLDEHWIKIKDGSGRTKLDADGITIFAELPSISYRMESQEYGTAIANLKGQARYHIPFQAELSRTNSSITGNFEISKASYKKTLDLMPDPLHLDVTIKTINKFLESLVKEKKVNTVERYAITSRPTTLNIKVQTSGVETATVSSNIAELAFVVNVSVLGTTRNILLSGDINAVGNGKLGYKGLTMFDLSSFRLYWTDLPIKQGVVDMHISNDYQFCSKEENCTIFVNLTGPLDKLNMQPSTNCNIDASPALIYYSMLLGCISAEYETDGSAFGSKLTNIALSKLLSTTGNRIFSKNVIGNIDVKWSFLQDNSQERDTSYVRIPFNLSKLVPNLEAVLGYTEDVGTDPRYRHSYEFGFRYLLPVFDSTDINRNLIDPSLGLNANLVARNYTLSAENSTTDETRLEKNIGLLYRHRFWDPCILGIGRCKIVEKQKN